MTRAPILAKLSAPAMEKVLPRTRLFERIDENRKRRVTWVTGPPGAGKTTLISSYIACRKLTCLWYQVDAGDGDVATFFHYLGLAAKNAAPRYRQPLPHLTPEYLAGLPVFARRYFEALALRLKPPCVLVLDNYQDVSAESSLHGVLCEGLAALPAGFTVIVISRNDPPAEHARLRANQNVAIIGWDDLRLTEAEAEGIVRLRKPHEFAPAEIAPLHEKTQGWAAGLSLLLEQGKADRRAAGSLQDSAPQVLFDYFAGEIFAKMESAPQEALLSSAFLPKMTAAMLAALSGFPEAGRLLAELNRKNYFTLRHANAEPVYEYHPLFREFLLVRARAAYAPAVLIEVKKRAAALLEADGQIEPAVALLQEAGDWNGVTRLSLTSARSLILQGRSNALEAWLKSLPSEHLSRTPWSLYWLGICRLAFAPAEARAYFERAYAGFKTGDDVPGIYLAWCAVVDSFIYEWGNFRPLDRWIAEMEALLRDRPGFPSQDIEAQVTCAMFLALMYPQPDHPELPMWERRVQQIMRTSEDVQLRAKVGNHLVIYSTWWTGDLAKAELLVNSQRALMQMPGTAPLVRVTWHTMAAGFYWMNAANEECIACVDQGLEIGRTNGVHTWDVLLCAQGAFASLSSGRMDTAAGYLKQMDALCNTSRLMDTAIYHHLSAWDSFMRGNLSRAHERAKAAVSLAEEACAVFPAAVSRTDFGRVLFYTGKQDEAQALVRQARTEARAMRSKSLEYVTFIVEAELALEREDEAACVDCLRSGLALGREQGFQNHTWWRTDMMPRLYAIALQHRIEVDYVHSMIRRRRLPPPASGATENWPWAIKIHTLGRFTILKDDTPLNFTGKLQRKPLELLKALIALGGRAVSDARLIESLWPDAEGDRGRHALEMALSRLRKLLGDSEAILSEGGGVSLNPHYLWLDVWALEQGLEQLARAVRAGVEQIASVTALAERMLALYRGPFLVEERDAPWALTLRERLRARFLRELRALWSALEQAGHLQQAAEGYQRGLEIDPLAEEFYQHLMLCYRALNRPAEALAVYQRCRQTLHRLLAITPSPETERIAQTLRQSN